MAKAECSQCGQTVDLGARVGAKIGGALIGGLLAGGAARHPLAALGGALAGGLIGHLLDEFVLPGCPECGAALQLLEVV